MLSKEAAKYIAHFYKEDKFEQINPLLLKSFWTLIEYHSNRYVGKLPTEKKFEFLKFMLERLNDCAIREYEKPEYAFSYFNVVAKGLICQYIAYKRKGIEFKLKCV
jgi:hypothetical protein